MLPCQMPNTVNDHRSVIAGQRPELVIGWLALALISSILALLGLKELTQAQDDTQDSSPNRPNILMIVADDLGYNDISSLNRDGIDTPSIDQLANNGVLFSRYYADTICAPSRVGLLTGREPERSGFRPGGNGIPQEFTTLPELLTNNGYQTKLVGKWHAGTAHRKSWPDHHGFKQWFGFLDQWQLQVPANSSSAGTRPSYWNPWLRRNSGPPEQHLGHLSDILLQESLDFLRHNKDSEEPWFLYHAFLAPHHPIEPDTRFAQRFPDTPEGQYRALVTQMDFSIGELINELEQSADLENTLVIFMSDNGGTNRQLNNNYPFKGSKAEVFEGSYRTPLVIHWPAQLQQQRQRAIVHNTDIYPSLISALGLVGTEQLDGRNLWPGWQAANAHDREYSEPALPGKARFWETYYSKLGLMSFSALSGDGRWRLSYDSQRTVSLYDLDDDPSGFTDVAAAHPGVIQSLKAKYVAASKEYALVPVNHTDSNLPQIAGFDQMRVTDNHQQTVLFELKSPINEDYAQELIIQPGDWVATIDNDRRFHLVGRGYDIVSAEPVPASCVVMALTFSYSKVAFLSPKPRPTTIKLYRNGLLDDSQELPPNSFRRENWPNTNVVSSRIGEVRFFNKMAFGLSEVLPYELLTTGSPQSPLTDSAQIFYRPTIEELSQGLCLKGAL
jgi:arylsulfatase A-like enzyme